ncbi:MAG: aliphatic sulfonate ABC transporter substrate-binding protein [Mesorhizobium sp.]|uniref:aliphatic sulfonate ABC transporter substrate-binding protein n=1 Tax=unclassified Mesorhizobium TaxID=325217 RepID=UPI000F74EABE|nr:MULTISPECIES: aliphatic sulfonate ABC transporter substrate-binding protein [unclassified Mesorhizobium]AZO67416.1 aliphatic sulfonate ABC transporter substrate-binding protein [Mesorhizobium sp. M6A.T.Cr.TU.016.01.1.1]RWQ66808.1 MAG: aliphatic sulfonate ABC transporter substrate-binding protein [Mesorhizobium sp.]RWQ85333.1 MAG: aliphatic sulfonate ABC transporter substrate-binding protein [Mesorhizobium sp.]
MPRISFSALRRLLLQGAIAAAVGASVVVAPAFAQDKPEVIRIGSTAPGHLKFILAQQDGWWQKEFAKDGIKVELVTFNGGSEATTALATGAIEVTYTGNNPALRVAASGADVKLIGVSSYVKAGGSSIIVKTDSPLKTLQDLKGKKVAYLTGTVRHSNFSKALNSVGLTTSDIEGLNLPFEASGPALLRDDIDAIVETDSTAAKLVDTGEARVLYDTSTHPEWNVPNVISVNGAFAAKYPDLVKRLLKVDIEISRWADAHPDETIKTFVEATKSSEKSVRKTYSQGLFYQDPKLTDDAIAALKSEEKFMAGAGLLKGSIDYSKWVDKSFVDGAYTEVAAVQ